MSSSSKNLQLINAMIGMCRRDAKWPHHLYDLGYGVKWIEYPFTCGNGETIAPDLVIVSSELNSCLLCECKSGSNIDDDQADRYKSVQPGDVVTKLFVDAPGGVSPTVDIPYLCFSEAAPSIIRQLTAVSAMFPVVEMSPNSIRLVANNFTVSKVTKVFKAGVTIDRNRIPMCYVPFDTDSSDSEIAPLVMQTLVAFASQNKPHFKRDEIAKDVVGDLWESFGEQKKKDLRNKVMAILGKAQQRELRGFLKRNGELWALSYSFPTSKTFPTRRLKLLSKKCNAFVKRIRDEERAEGRQLPLFSDQTL